MKTKNVKKLLILIFMIVLELLYDAGLLYYQMENKLESELIFDEAFKFIDALFLVLIFRLFHKIIFYKHQILSMIIILLVGLVRFIIQIFYKHKENNFKYDTIFFIIFFPFIDSIQIYVLQKYMKYNYYSPYFICFLIGIIHLIINFIILISLYGINCGDSFFTDICNLLSKINIEPNFETISASIIYSIIYALEHYIKLITINNFTAFHLILIVVFGEFINDIFVLIFKFDYIDLLIYFFTYSIEILGVLVFIEAIELNFCNLNINLKKNIILRAGGEINLLYNYQNENESEESEENLIEDSKVDESNIVYE